MSAGRENHREAPETGRLRSRSPLQLLGGQGDSRLFCTSSFYFCCAPPAQKQTAHALRTRAATNPACRCSLAPLNNRKNNETNSCCATCAEAPQFPLPLALCCMCLACTACAECFGGVGTNEGMLSSMLWIAEPTDSTQVSLNAQPSLFLAFAFFAAAGVACGASSENILVPSRVGCSCSLSARKRRRLCERGRACMCERERKKQPEPAQDSMQAVSLQPPPSRTCARPACPTHPRLRLRTAASRFFLFPRFRVFARACKRSRGSASPWRSSDEQGRCMAGHNEHEEYQMLNAPVRLVDHPDYEAPRLKSTWLQMLPRMMCGCAILLAVVVPMVSVVWSVVSNAPGDPLHHHPGKFRRMCVDSTLRPSCIVTACPPRAELKGRCHQASSVACCSKKEQGRGAAKKGEESVGFHDERHQQSPQPRELRSCPPSSCSTGERRQRSAPCACWARAHTSPRTHQCQPAHGPQTHAGTDVVVHLNASQKSDEAMKDGFDQIATSWS